MSSMYTRDWLSKLRLESERLETFSGGHNISIHTRLPADLAKDGFFVAGGEKLWCAWCMTGFRLETQSDRIRQHARRCTSLDINQRDNIASPSNMPQTGYSTQGACAMDPECLVSDRQREDAIRNIRPNQRDRAREVIQGNVVTQVQRLGVRAEVILRTIIIYFRRNTNTECNFHSVDDFLQEAIRIYRGNLYSIDQSRQIRTDSWGNEEPCSTLTDVRPELLDGATLRGSNSSQEQTFVKQRTEAEEDRPRQQQPPLSNGQTIGGCKSKPRRRKKKNKSKLNGPNGDNLEDIPTKSEDRCTDTAKIKANDSISAAKADSNETKDDFKLGNQPEEAVVPPTPTSQPGYARTHYIANITGPLDLFMTLMSVCVAVTLIICLLLFVLWFHHQYLRHGK